MLWVLSAKVILGATVMAAPDLPDPSSDVVLGQILQVFLALAVTLATIWGLSKLAMKKRWNSGFKNQRIKILDSLAVGTRDRIMLIEVDNQNILVASTPGQIRSLHSFEKLQTDNFKSTLDLATSDSTTVEDSE